MIAVLWVCWFLIINGVRTEPRNFRLVLDDIIVSDRDPDLMEKLEVQLSQRNNRSYVDAQIIFKRNFKDMSARTALDFWKSSNTKMRLYDVRLDACLFLDVSHKNRLFNIYAKALRNYSNLSCPFKANFTYTFKQLYFDEQELPSFIPLGVFRALIEYSTKQKLSARIKIRGKIVPRL
ncbi:uncharacterized protein [Drosophila pseudoobscura]|uniref:Uncharacterized protein n=1 Tax=Drosophila pseudoobscura pseudoobscura TaxID=46245 RepID=A0A6I8UWY5_DROPS|nr:uncharacterized protein LOC6903431 [Drosophila pseudoobscura]